MNKKYLVFLSPLTCLLLAACGGRSLDGSSNGRGMSFDASPGVLGVMDGGADDDSDDPSNDDPATDDPSNDDPATDDRADDATDDATDDAATDDVVTDDGNDPTQPTPTDPSNPPPSPPTATPPSGTTGPIGTTPVPTTTAQPPITPTASPTIEPPTPTGTGTATPVPTTPRPPPTGMPTVVPTSTPTTPTPTSTTPVPTSTSTSPTPTGTVTPPPTTMPTTPPPPIDIPDDCRDESQSVSTSYCEYSLSCDDTYVYSYCSKNGDRFDCNCSTDRQSFSWGLSGIDSSQACELIASICLSDDEPEFSGPRVCAPSYSSEQRDFCEESESCGQAADLGGGVTLWSTEYQSAWCSKDDDAWNCNCQSGSIWQNYILSGVSTPPCPTAKDLCSGVIVPTYDGATTCSPESQSTTPNSCSLYEQCVQKADLGGGVSAELATYRSTSCTAGTSDWACSCGTDHGQISFSKPPASSALQTCQDATTLCSSLTDVQPSGPMTCENSGQSSGQGYCNLQLTCGQSATVDGVEVSVDGQLYTSCWEESDGMYYCDCYSGSDYDSFEFASAASEWETCEAASLECQQRVTVQIGPTPGGGGGIPPFPGGPIFLE